MCRDLTQLPLNSFFITLWENISPLCHWGGGEPLLDLLVDVTISLGGQDCFNMRTDDGEHPSYKSRLKHTLLFLEFECSLKERERKEGCRGRQELGQRKSLNICKRISLFLLHSYMS